MIKDLYINPRFLCFPVTARWQKYDVNDVMKSVVAVNPLFQVFL